MMYVLMGMGIALGLTLVGIIFTILLFLPTVQKWIFKLLTKTFERTADIITEEETH